MRWQQIVPITVVVLLIALLGYGLTREPGKLPSALIGKALPEFNLPALDTDAPRLTSQAIAGQVMLVNVWASWCVPCRVEHPQITRIALAADTPIIGINYKDTRPAARQWLNQLGNPFTRIAYDEDGQLAFDLGVSGVPESFIIDEDGVIRHKIVGPITPEIMTEEVLPLLQRLQQEAT